MFRRVYFFIFFTILEKFTSSAANETAWTPICADTGWEKVPGMKPEYITSSDVLYAGVNSEGIVVTCFKACLGANCTAFIIDFKESTCFSVTPGSEEFVPEPQASYYHQICIRVPPSCRKTRLWQVERTLGAVLIDTTSIRVTNFVTRTQCYEKCIAAGSMCQSAQFRTIRDLAIGDSQGNCTLQSISRGTRPQSYRASMYKDEYLETECHDLSSADYCSYAEYRDETLPYSDLKVPGLGILQCEQRCNAGNDGFLCRSYTIDNSTYGQPVCLLHSDDTIGAGVSSLVDKPGVIYKEREPCLNLKVRCTNTSMTVEFTTTEPFRGRLYASGYGDSCGVQGNGETKTILVIDLPDKGNLSLGNTNCGVTPAYAMDNQNRTRTAVWVTVIVQFNPIVQRLGDQSVRAGCTLDEPDIPEPMNVTVNAGFDFADPSAGTPPITWTIFNTTTVPIVTMRILDENQNDVTVTHLGDKLTLRIDISPPGGPYDISAGHLVASSASGASSILLLDEMGCPSDPKIFPAMTRDTYNNKSLLSTFTAFKFPDSPRVRFDVVVKFCLGKCDSVKCRGGSTAYGKKRRSVNDTLPSTNVSDVSELMIHEGTIDELPLQRSIIVQDPVISADPLLGGKTSNPDTVLIAGEKTLDGLLCVDAALVLGLLIFWLCVQIVLTFGCIILVRRYRKHARKAEEDRADILARHLYGIHGGNFEIARRVRWADHNGSSMS
ncbi:uncharacterized protein [Venturia canescens]|uniref:uncharacterized protein n=1 Tax=Venturia canescens TaxID=32260 RepID=UPI001C9C1541|nr:uncharacterized protein LOC122414123 [Venturia canescens]